MAIIELDTDTLRSAVNAAQQLSDTINQAKELLNKIVIHDDWECREREAIKNYTIENREQIARLNENAQAYFKAVGSAAERFEEEERRHISMQQTVDGILAAIHNVAPGGAAGSVSIASFGNISSGISNK